jgi:hypothetical protein
MRSAENPVTKIDWSVLLGNDSEDVRTQSGFFFHVFTFYEMRNELS